MSQSTQRQIERCREEQARCRAEYLRSGDLMALMGFADWHIELHLILEEQNENTNTFPAKHRHRLSMFRDSKWVTERLLDACFYRQANPHLGLLAPW